MTEKSNLRCRVGIIGMGQMGILHAAISNSLGNSEVKAFCDTNRLILRLARKALPTVAFYSDYSEMIRKERLDAIYVCTPAQTHQRIVSDIVSIDKATSVFVEKPLATSHAEALKMIQDSRLSSGVKMVGFQKRFAGVFARTKELLSKGAIGEPFLFRSHHFGSSVTTNNEGWKFQGGSGGATLEFGVHLLDLLIWFFGEPTSVESSKKSIFSSSVEDYVVSHTTFQNDLSGSVEIGWSMRNYAPDQIMIEIHGRNGTLNVTEDRLKIYVDSSVENVVEEGIHEYTSFELDPVVPFLLAHPENVAQEEHFLKCVQGRDKPTTSFEDAAKVNRFVDMILSK